MQLPPVPSQAIFLHSRTCLTRLVILMHALVFFQLSKCQHVLVGIFKHSKDKCSLTSKLLGTSQIVAEKPWNLPAIESSAERTSKDFEPIS